MYVIYDVINDVTVEFVGFVGFASYTIPVLTFDFLTHAPAAAVVLLRRFCKLVLGFVSVFFRGRVPGARLPKQLFGWIGA